MVRVAHLCADVDIGKTIGNNKKEGKQMPGDKSISFMYTHYRYIIIPILPVYRRDQRIRMTVYNTIVCSALPFPSHTWNDY